jgi:hypothetical protein
MAIFINGRLSKEDIYSVNPGLSTIDKLYGLYCEVSSLGLSQTERCATGGKNTNVKQTPENHMFGRASKLTVFCYL